MIYLCTMDQATVNRIIASLKAKLDSNGLKVDSIAVFGSALHGEMTTGSDIDLIIISEDFEGKDIFERALMTMQAESALMKKFVVPMDILNLTPQEYRERNSIGFFESRVVG